MVPDEIEFHPERADYVAVARGSFRHSLTRRRFRRRLAIAVVVLIAIGLTLRWLDDDAWSVGWTLFAIGALFVWLTIVVTIQYLLIPRRAGRLFGQHRSIDRTFSMAWDDAGITQRWDSGTTRTAWTEYHDRFETGHVFAFGLTEQLYHFAPKRVMSPDQCVSLRAAATAIDTPPAAT